MRRPLIVAASSLAALTMLALAAAPGWAQRG